MAGVSAAKRLKEKDLKNVLVVEGADRIGGRVKDVPFGGINVEVGANWVHFSNMKKSEINPIELMVAEAKLKVVSDDYSDVIFRYKGRNVTEEYTQVYSRLEQSLEKVVELAKRKEEMKEPDINFRAALAISGWRPKHPLEKAAEYFDFDFEFGDEPEDSGLKSNSKVWKEETIFFYLSYNQWFRFLLSTPKMISSLQIPVGSHRHRLEQNNRNPDILIVKVIRDIAESAELEEGRNLLLNKYVTDVHYNETGDRPVKVVSRDTKTGKMTIFRAKWVIMTFR